MADFAVTGMPGNVQNAVALTPADDMEIETTKGLYIGVEGDVTVLHPNSHTPVTYKNLSGFAPLFVTRVYDTDTDATDILALY